ncbi:hypothetical protein BTM25_38330 [Actinomadura rubteroloni]|uniref:DUF5753 domain-containing protein n=1 Tax=Actinomadura rubteroloni TaxID=1926885 RepID=A0A2P4UJH7_9ACTN|nr:DUF5753 domain-containing protein [Actinomadura rubteroloni]POM25190.1 hypothetical protein BTM25_38330 [Actinomadura rubteroloni]
MPNEERQNKIADVISLLQENRHISGTPSFGTIENFAKELAARPQPVLEVEVGELPHSTVYDLLTRNRERRRRMPRQDLVESLWATLAVYGAERGKDVAKMHTLAELRARMAAIDAVPTPSGADLARTHGVAAGTSAEAAAEALANGTHGCCSLVPPRADDPGGGVRTEVGRDRIRAVQRCARLRDTHRRSPRVWWYGFRDVVPPWFEVYLTLEPELASIRTYAPRRVPGLLQTPAYAERAIARDRPGLPAAELARRVEMRLARQHILHRPDPPRLWCVVEEKALPPTDWPDDVRREQIRHLLDVALLPHVCIQLMPSDSDGASDGPLTLLRLPEQGFPDLIFLEQANHGLYPHGPGDERYYAGLFNSLATQASTPDASVRRLHALLGRLQPEDH